MYCDEIRGIFPLLIFPDEKVKNNEILMRPIYYHPIWFLDAKGDDSTGYIDLIYKGRIYSAKKFQVLPEVEKNYHRSEELAFNMVSIIMVFPKEMSYYKKIFTKFISDTIQKNFKNYFQKIIKSEKIKEDLIKIPRNEIFIKEGDHLKENIKKFLKTLLRNHFSSIESNYNEEPLVNLEY